MKTLLYEENPPPAFIKFKEYWSVFFGWSIGLFVEGFIVYNTLMYEPADPRFLMGICASFLLFILFYFFIGGRELQRGFVEEAHILVAGKNILLETPIVRTIPVERISRIIFDSRKEKIIIFLKSGGKICLDRTFGNLFDMVKGTKEEDLRIAPLLKALKEAGIKYEIIWREM